MLFCSSCFGMACNRSVTDNSHCSGYCCSGAFAAAQQPTGTSLENLLSGRETGRSFFCSYVPCTICWQNSCLCLEHVTIKLWTLQQNKTHIYNHIYIISEYTFAASCNILMACPDRASSWSNLLLKCCKDFASTTMTSRTIRLWSMSPERSER